MNDDVLFEECRIPELAAKNEKNIPKPVKLLSQLLFGFPISVISLLARSCSVLFDSRPRTNLAGHVVVRTVSSGITNHCEENTVGVSAGAGPTRQHRTPSPRCQRDLGLPELAKHPELRTQQ